MNISVFTTTCNDEAILPFFIEFYKKRIPDVRFYIWDINSTDQTKDIAIKNNCNIKNFNDLYLTKDQWKNECWKNTGCDCVILCDVNEFIDVDFKIFVNCSIVCTKGYDIDSIQNLNLEKRNHNKDKFCIFDPHVIKEMNYEGDNFYPKGFIRLGTKYPILYHLTNKN